MTRGRLTLKSLSARVARLELRDCERGRQLDRIEESGLRIEKVLRMILDERTPSAKENA